MTIHLFRMASLATILAIAAAGCAMHDTKMASSTGTPAAMATSANAFPTGRFQNGDLIAVMNPDGTYVGTTPTGDDWVKGTYVVDGDMLAITDRWMAEQFKDDSCVGKGAGRYRWAATTNGMSYTRIDDPCAPRAKGMGDHGAWTRIP